jgi:hypothetical protein
MTRRVFLFAGSALPLLADSTSDAWDVIAAMAAALAEDNPPGFMRPVDMKLPGYDTLSRDVQGMLAQSEAQSGINLISNEGDDFARTIVVEWELRLKRKGPDLRMDVRRQGVTLKLVRERKRWMVVSIDPISLFAPPNFR